LDKSVHFSRHRHADLFLDAFSYNASTTTLDALWGGLPVLTRKGNYFQSRIAASMLKNVGLEDMICQSTQEYEDRAVGLANNPEMLASLRERLWINRGTMPLFDTKRFVVNLEAAYETMWRQYKTGALPEGFDVPSSVHPPGV
jgi:predicted O-linked N-acetylglucosamine transferase (SPINDLY family)